MYLKTQLKEILNKLNNELTNINQHQAPEFDLYLILYTIPR